MAFPFIVSPHRHRIGHQVAATTRRSGPVCALTTGDAVATGGTISVDLAVCKIVHTFSSSGTFSLDEAGSLPVDVTFTGTGDFGGITSDDTTVVSSDVTVTVTSGTVVVTYDPADFTAGTADYAGLLADQGASSYWALDTIRASTETEPDLIGSVDFTMTGGASAAASTPFMSAIDDAVTVTTADTEGYVAANSFDPDQDWSLSGWFKFGTLAASAILWSWFSNNSSNYLYLIHRDDQSGLAIQIGDGGTAKYIAGIGDYEADDKWHHIAVTRDYDATATLDVWTIYVDGAEVVQTTRDAVGHGGLQAGGWSLGNRGIVDIGVDADLAAWGFAEGTTWTADEVWRQFSFGLAEFPLDVPIPKNWLDAALEQGYTDGDSISTLTDFSPLSAHFTTIASYTDATWETDGLDGATTGFRFNGTSTGTEQASGDLVSALAAGTEAEMYAVLKLDSEFGTTGSGGWWQICGFTNPSNHYTFNDGNVYDGTFSTTRKSQGSTTRVNHAIDAKHVANIRQSTTTYSRHTNGTQDYTVGAVFGVSGTARLGRSIASGSPGDNHRGDGDYAGHVIFGEILDSTERASFEAWLVDRFGVTL